MPYVAPSTVVAGQTYSAASHNVIVNDIIDHEDRLDTVQNTQYPARNVLINGAMQIAQRGTSVSGITANTATTYYTADRWGVAISANGTFTNAITADTPTGQGFANAFRMTATASAATAAASYVVVSQRLEGQTLQHIKKGTANAQQLTLQFWVKSNRTGTYIAELWDNNSTRSVSATYTINASDTWEQKTITFPADTTGAFTNDANFSLAAQFWLSAGTTFTSGTLNTSWAARTAANIAAGQTNVAGATNGYWQVTGVQLEPGSQASPYEFVLYQDELRRCQRYYYRHADASGAPICIMHYYSTTAAQGFIQFATPMRAKPTSAIVNGTNYFSFYQAGLQLVSTINVSAATVSPMMIQADIGSLAVSTVGTVGELYVSNPTAGGVVAFSAEL